MINQEIVRSSEKDLKKIAICHTKAFPKSLATALGRNYVQHMLSWYLSSGKTFMFHLESDTGICLGYLGGMVTDGSLGTGSSSGMAQYSFRAAIIAIMLRPWVFFHPEVRGKWPLLWKNILMKFRLKPMVHFNAEQKQKMVLAPKAGLVVIGVDPVFQGHGFGSILLKEFERFALQEYGVRILQLSVLANNHKAIKAYKRNGWYVINTGPKTLSMEKIL